MFKLMSITTLYSIASISAITVGAVITIIERFRKLTLPDRTFQGAIVEMNVSSGFVLIALVPFLYYIEIKKRIQFINRWGIFQVCCFWPLVYLAKSKGKYMLTLYSVMFVV